MGAVGSSRLVAAHPERFDAAAFLGGPLDATLLLETMERSLLGGFCPAARLEAALLLDQGDGGNRLDRPDGVAGCTPANVSPLGHYGRAQRFNHWAFTTNGGTFDRGTHIDIFRDLTLALGNPLTGNPLSPSLPRPLAPADFAAASCANPKRFEHVYDPVYSPHGEHSAITFCDGDPPVMTCADGALVDFCAAAALAGRQLANESDADGFCASHGGSAHEVGANSGGADADAYFAHHGEVSGCWAGTELVPFALAIDLNGNGRRDYHEPLVVQGHEPFSDVGVDGCPDALEDGKGGCTTAALSPYAAGVKDPNGDNYDPVKNPAGTEGDGRWEPHEPFQDVGLDGVDGTHDQGEGDGQFTVSSTYAHWQAEDLRLSLSKMSETQKASLDLYVEGGIRDVFDLGAQAEALAGGVQLALPGGVHSFLDFLGLPQHGGNPWTLGFDAQKVDIAAMGHNVFLPYGNPSATPAEIRAGDGDHVGSVAQAVDRFLIFFRWLSGRWDAAVPPLRKGGVGTILQQHYTSTVLGAERDFGISFPPGYDDPANAGRRYPVLFLLHGYGQAPADFSATSIFVDTLGNVGQMREIIVVYPDGRCCLNGPNGERVCREQDANGVDYSAQGYVRECARGTFFVNRQGLTGTDKTRYGDQMFELMDHVDATWRTLAPADGPAF